MRALVLLMKGPDKGKNRMVIGISRDGIKKINIGFRECLLFVVGN